MRLLPERNPLAVPNQVSAIAIALEQVPLPPVARAALFEAIAISGAYTLATTTPAERLPATGRGSTAGPPLALRNELIFEPRTKTLLASETGVPTGSR